MTNLPSISFEQLVGDAGLVGETRLEGHGPSGSLPITVEMLLNEPSGNLFGMTQNAGMGWDPDRTGDPQFLIVSTQGGLRAPDGTDHWVGGIYKELTPPERIVFTHAWQDEAGHAEHETVVTITLKDLGDGKTQLTFHQAFFLSDASRDGHGMGWTESLDNLETYLAGREAA